MSNLALLSKIHATIFYIEISNLNLKIFILKKVVSLHVLNI